MRPVGRILLELEPLLEELIDDHDVQKGDVLALVATWIDVHRAGAIERYVDDGSMPVLFYGSQDDLKKRFAE